MAVKLPGKDDKYAVHVITADSIFTEPLSPTEAIESCKELFIDYCEGLNATNIATEVETVSFCGINTSVCSISYIVEDATNYILCHVYNIEHGFVAVATYGHTKEEAIKLMEAFYYIED